MAEEPGDPDPPERDGTDDADSGGHDDPDPTEERRSGADGDRDAASDDPAADGTDDADGADGAGGTPGDGTADAGAGDDPGDDAGADGEPDAPDQGPDPDPDPDAGPDPDTESGRADEEMWAGLGEAAAGAGADADEGDGEREGGETADGYDPSGSVDPAEMGIQTTDRPSADGGYADGTDPGMYEGFDDSYDEFPVEGAPDDEEMPLADHIEEMVRRLGVVIVVIAVVSAVTFPLADRLINFLWFSYLPGSIESCPESAARAGAVAENAAGVACPRVYNPLALILARLKVASLVGFVVALPVFVYESYLFMRPGLYPRERRYYLASVPTSLVLATVGVLFAHALVLPVLFTYFLYYSTDATTMIAFGLTQTFDLMVLMLGGFALIFQIPLFVMLALMMGIVTRGWLADRRILFWGAFAGLAFLFSPDPTGMAPIIVAATMIVLFEGTLLLARWTRRGGPAAEPEEPPPPE